VAISQQTRKDRDFFGCKGCSRTCGIVIVVIGEKLLNYSTFSTFQLIQLFYYFYKNFTP